MRKSRSGDPKRAIGYVRVSTDDQALGPDAQRASVAAWAASRGVEVVAWYFGLGVSGGTPVERRSGLLAAIGALREHGAGVLVAAKRDRLGRDLVIMATLERLVQRSGAVLLTADGVGGQGTSPEDQLLRCMVDAFAQYERALIRARTRAALAVKRSRGERTGELPYGWGQDGATGKLAACAEEQAVLSQIASLRACGASVRAIAATLNERGVPARGARWHKTTVGRLILGRAAG